MNEIKPDEAKNFYAGPIQIKAGEGSDIESVLSAEELVKRHVEQFGRWEQWRRPMETMWSEVYRLLFSQGKGDKLPTRAKIVLPLVFQIIEAAVPKLVTVIFGQPEWFKAKSRSSKSPVSSDKLVAFEELLRYQLKLSDYFPKFVDFFKGLFMYGTAYIYVYWAVKREWVHTRTPMRQDVTEAGHVIAENELQWAKKKSYEVTERRPEMEVLPIEDVYPDPYARSEAYSEGVYISSTISLSELESMSKGPFPIYGNFDKVKQMCQGSDAYEKQQFKQEKRSIRGTGEPTHASKGQNIELLSFWGREDLDGDGIKEEVLLVLADRQVLVRAIPNPFEHQKRPIIRGVLFPVAHEWFGMGLIEPVIGLINELITIRRQNLDMNNLIINRMWKVHSMADIDVDTIHSSPNGIIVTGDMDGIEPIPQEPIPMSPLEMSQLIQNDIENATAPKSIQGAPQSGALGRTFKGAQLIVSQALEKFGLGAKLIEESVITKVLWMYKKLNEQFLDDDKVLSYFYGDIVNERLTPEDIRLDLDFELLGISETVTRETTINQLISFYNLAVNNPTVNTTRVLQEIWKLMQLNVNPAEVFMPSPAPLATSLAVNPNISEGTENAIAGQVQQNGPGAPIAVPGQ